MMLDILIQQLKRHEGLRLKPYRCTADKLTIGYGRNLDEVGISLEEAEMLLLDDVKHIVQLAPISFPWYDGLSDNRKAVLCNMMFNLGISRLMKFKKMLLALEEGNFDEASFQMLDSRWARQVGKRATELAHLMRKG